MCKEQREWVTVNNVSTKIITWRKSLNDSALNETNEGSNYIICIPGNPGITEMYLEFLEEIHKRTNQNVWVIGHAGQEIIDIKHMPPRQENKHLYNLHGQIKHKQAFIEKFLPHNARITFIGHSIGSYIILELLKVPSIKSRVVNSYLLFPTIEYMAESNNGKKFMGIFRHLFCIMFPLITFFNLLPVFVQNSLVYIFCKISGIPQNYSNIIKNFVNPFTIGNVTSMALEEMHQVRERDNDTLKENIATIRLYYGTTDDWVPLTYYNNLKRDIPNINAEVCDKGLAHAFVLRDSKPMANIVMNWIKMQ